MILFFIALVIMAAGVMIYLLHPKFGAMPRGEDLIRIHNSSNYHGDEFKNLEPTQVIISKKDFLKILWDHLQGARPGLTPDRPIPALHPDFKSLDLSHDMLIWLGHSTFYLQLNGLRILIDPVFSKSAAPIDFANRAFAGTTIFSADDFPIIDVVLITHNHWDHLDYPTMTALRPKVRKVVTALGVGATLEQWGFAREDITELDWFDSRSFSANELNLSNELIIHAIPSRHFSGRLLRKNQTLWTGFAVFSPGMKLLFSGDTGYGRHFADIGRRLGPFDVAALDMGQYDPLWPQMHMTPEDASQAARDLNTRFLIPAHVGKFALAHHTWQNPFNRITAASNNAPYTLLTPKIGEVTLLPLTKQSSSSWWLDKE